MPKVLVSDNGDYMSTSIVPGTRMAFPVFADAFRPTGSLQHENMYTSLQLVTGDGSSAISLTWLLDSRSIPSVATSFVIRRVETPASTTWRRR